MTAELLTRPRPRFSWSRASDTTMADLRAALLRRATRMLGRDPSIDGEDLVQLTLAKLLHAYPDLASWDEERRAAFAFVTLHRTFVDVQRTRREEARATFDTETSMADSPEVSLQRRRASSALERCLATLRDEARRFLLRSFELDSAPSAQAEVGWPHGGAANACHTRRRLVSSVNDCLADGRRSV